MVKEVTESMAEITIIMSDMFSGLLQERKIILWIYTIWLSAVVCKDRPSSTDTSLESLAATGTANERKCVPLPHYLTQVLIIEPVSAACLFLMPYSKMSNLIYVQVTSPSMMNAGGKHGLCNEAIRVPTYFALFHHGCPFVLTLDWKMPHSVLPLLKGVY